MLCVIPFFAGDRQQAIALAHWIKDLGGVKKHDCLLIVDEGTTVDGVIEPLREAFASVSVEKSQSVQSKGKWGDGTTDASAPNEMWLTACMNIYGHYKRPWFWLESDACPMRSTWLDEIEAEYLAGKKPFMGAYVDIPPHEPHMSGIAVYPISVANYSLDMTIPGRIAWDYAGRKDTVGKGKAHFTDLIQHEYRVHGESPTFPTQESLSIIKPRTAVFHRCKDTSLIERLRERLLGHASPLTTISGRDEVSEDAGSNPAVAINPTEVMLARAMDRIQELEEEVKSLKISKTFAASGKTGSKRTPEQQAIINARMAKARAGRKKLTGVK